MTFRITAQVIGTFDVEARTRSDGEPLRFRVELLRRHGRAKGISARIWRQEFYRIQPTFPQRESVPAHEPCDELILVEETSLLGCDKIAKDLQKALAKVLARLNDQLLGHPAISRRRKGRMNR